MGARLRHGPTGIAAPPGSRPHRDRAPPGTNTRTNLQDRRMMRPVTSIQHPHRGPLGWGIALVGLMALAGAALGCPSPDAEGKYERFNEQTEDDREMPEPKMDFGAPVLPDFGGEATGTGGGGGLAIDGVYLVAVDTVVSPGLPLQFLGEVTAELDAMGNGTISVEFQPLSLDQGNTTSPREE